MFDWFKKKDEKKSQAKPKATKAPTAKKPMKTEKKPVKPAPASKASGAGTTSSRVGREQSERTKVTAPKKPVKVEKAVKKEKPVQPVKVPKQKAAEKPTLPAKAEQTAPAVLKEPASAKEVKEKLQQGWTHCLITFELVGKPKEHIDNTLKAYIENVKLDPRIRAVKEEFAEALEHDDGLFSAFCEVEAIVQDLDTLTWIAVNFMPASIEILAPEKREVEARMVTNWYNDLIAKLHETSNVIREQRAIATHLTESLNALIKNSIKAALQSGAKTPAELEASLGITAAQLEPFLKHLVEKGQVKQDGETYSL